MVISAGTAIESRDLLLSFDIAKCLNRGELLHNEHSAGTTTGTATLFWPVEMGVSSSRRGDLFFGD